MAHSEEIESWLECGSMPGSAGRLFIAIVEGITRSPCLRQSHVVDQSFWVSLLQAAVKK